MEPSEPFDVPMAVTGADPVEDQVRRFVEGIDTSDPRSTAQAL
ncbi:hypothetical protein [Streptomyces roseolus]